MGKGNRNKKLRKITGDNNKRQHYIKTPYICDNLEFPQTISYSPFPCMVGNTQKIKVMAIPDLKIETDVERKAYQKLKEVSK